MKLNVKPVYVHLVHRSAYMGPCRGGTWEQLERSYDEMMAAENFAKMKEGLEKVYGGEKDNLPARAGVPGVFGRVRGAGVPL